MYFSGITPQSELARAGMYHMPKREKQKSEYSHTIYSNTRSRTKTKNLERHKELLKERAERKKNITKERSEAKGKRKKKISDGFSV